MQESRGSSVSCIAGQTAVGCTSIRNAVWKFGTQASKHASLEASEKGSGRVLYTSSLWSPSITNLSLLAITHLYHGPFTAPCPLARSGITTLFVSELLVLAFRQPNDSVSFTRS